MALRLIRPLWQRGVFYALDIQILSLRAGCDRDVIPTVCPNPKILEKLNPLPPMSLEKER
jgi:hypothetical protein